MKPVYAKPKTLNKSNHYVLIKSTLINFFSSKGLKLVNKMRCDFISKWLITVSILHPLKKLKLR